MVIFYDLCVGLYLVTLHGYYTNGSILLIELFSILPQVKLWDLSNNQPSCVATRNPKAVRNPQFCIYSCEHFLGQGVFLSYLDNVIIVILQVQSKQVLACFFPLCAPCVCEYVNMCVGFKICFLICYQGAVFSISFSEDRPFLLAIGGSTGKLEVEWKFPPKFLVHL